MNAWHGNWRQRNRSRLQAQGFEKLTDYLRKKPGVPYVQIADLLGKTDVAAFQVAWLHYEEAVSEGKMRQAAMDSLARDVAYHLPDGWKENPTGDFDTAGVYSNWINRLEEYAEGIEPVANGVWSALLAQKPPAGWRPAGPEDPHILHAFGKGWPSDLSVNTKIAPRPAGA